MWTRVGFHLIPSPHKLYVSEVSSTQVLSLQATNHRLQFKLWNAAGYAIPSLVNTAQKILKAELMFGEVPETMYGLSSSGWIDSEILNAWFQNHFLIYA